MSKIEIVSLIIIVVIAILYLAWQIKKKGLRQTAVDLMVEAERKFKSGNGSLKMQIVVTGLFNKLGFPFTMIPYSTLEKFAQEIFDELKESIEFQGNKHLKGE